MNGLTDWFGKNLTWIIGVSVATAIAWGSLNVRVGVIAQEQSKIEVKLTILQDISERLVRLEEGKITSAEDIKEMKEDIKDIKRHFEIK